MYDPFPHPPSATGQLFMNHRSVIVNMDLQGPKNMVFEVPGARFVVLRALQGSILLFWGPAGRQNMFVGFLGFVVGFGGLARPLFFVLGPCRAPKT